MKRYGLYAALLGVVLSALGVSPLLAILIIVVVVVYKSISDLERLLGKIAEKNVGFDDRDREFEDEEWE
jgi:hypothetical protein